MALRQPYPVGDLDNGALVQVTKLPAIQNAYYAQASIVRPDNTTAYAANDVVGGLYHFHHVGPRGEAVYITDLTLRVDVASVPAGMSYFTLYLYNEPPVAYADNAAWDLTSVDRTRLVRSIIIPAPVDVGSTLYIESSGINRMAKLTSDDLFGYLVTSAAYTPTALAAKTIEMYTVVA